MTIEDFTQSYNSVLEALDKSQLLDALDLVDQLQKCVYPNETADYLRLLREDYAHLLNYMKSGAPDDERMDFFAEYLRKAYRVADNLRRQFILQHTDLPAAIVYRRLHKSQEEVADVYVPFVEGNGDHPASLDELLHDPLVSYAQLYDTVWTSHQWSDTQCRHVQNYINNPDASIVNRLTLVNAIGVALLFCFDENKFFLLFDLIQEDKVQVSVRAIVMLLIASNVYETRLKAYPELNLKFNILNELTHLHPLIIEVQKAFLIAHESPTLSRDFDDNLPDRIIQVHEHMSELPDGMSHEELEEYVDTHPKLRKFRNAMIDAMHELAEMHQKGVDLNYHSFNHMQDELPFFDEAHNWHCPYNPEHPLLFNIGSMLRFLSAITNNKSCDTDRFALLFTIAPRLSDVHIVKQDPVTLQETHIEGNDVESFLSEFADAMEHRAAREDRSLLTLSPERLRTHVVSCVQDIHRFFTLLASSDLPQVFEQEIRLWQSPLLRNIFTTDETIRDLADWIFELENYEQAIILYNRLEHDADIHQRIGFAYEKIHDYAAAQRHYREALVLNPDDEWTTHQLIDLYVSCGQHYDAATLLDVLVEQNPDDHRLTRRYAEVLFDSEDYQGALPLYSKISYLHPNHIPIARDFARCLFRCCQFERAANILNDVIASPKVQPDDYAYCGHIALIQNDIPSAIVYYQEALRLEDNERASLDLFIEELPVFEQHEITTTTLQLVVDILNM